MVNRLVSDLSAVARAARTAPLQLRQILELGEEIATIGRTVLAVAERLDRRAEAIMQLGERLDQRAAELLELGREMGELGHRIDVRGAEIVDGASRVANTGNELITVLPAFERALEMASPLEGAIDRFGRLVDRLPGGTARRRPGQPGEPPPGVDAAAGAEGRSDPAANAESANPSADPNANAAANPSPAANRSPAADPSPAANRSPAADATPAPTDSTPTEPPDRSTGQPAARPSH